MMESVNQYLGFPHVSSHHKMMHTYLLWGDICVKRKKWSGYIKSKYPISSSLNPQNFLVPLVEQVKDGVVSIVTEDHVSTSRVDQMIKELFRQQSANNLTTERSFGSGFIFHPSGYILTSEHVVGKSKTILVKLCNGRIFEAKRVHSDPVRDYAIIKINADCRLYPLPLGDSTQTKVGEWVISIGSPSCAKGIKMPKHRHTPFKGQKKADHY